MNGLNIIWTPAVMGKLIQFRSERFTPEETLDFIFQLILETEELLGTDVIGKSYTEEIGKYKGISRIVVKRFRVYH
jgi:hypothetical protein